MADDVWAGIPDDLRRQIREYAISDWVKDTPAEAALCDALRSLVSRLQEAEKDRDRLHSAIRWALGEEGHFEPLPDPKEGRYWWRTELRRLVRG